MKLLLHLNPAEVEAEERVEGRDSRLKLSHGEKRFV